MNNTNKKIVFFLSVMLLTVLFVSFASMAFAETAQYHSTQVFLDYLDQKSVKYKYSGVDSDADEVVKVSYSVDNYDSLTITLFFDEDCDSVSMRMWNILTATAGKNFILNTLAELNADYKYAKFVYDPDDSSIQAELDMYINANTCGRPVLDAISTLITIVDNDEVYAKLSLLE